ncbi:BadF/BadG/BcrA/BcrD ATPase family protein, partial [Sphingomonas bacterium]|uniref:BadF/BadG/BcrA/BcrD ATPase family protein n=1 Tax=Sphingomonas bacterium TaxID=1895847 RepID=UPI0015769E74
AGPAFARAVAVSDAHIACLGAFAGRDGAILITGTGSAAHAVIDGVGRPVFGWGFEVDDKGSAAALGRDAIAGALDAHDGLLPETELTRGVRGVIGGTAGAMVKWITAARPKDYGALAPMILAAARDGDAFGLSLVRRSAADLDRMIARLVAMGASRVCLMGGMALYIEPWLAPRARDSLTPPEHDAITGASLLARRSIHEDE